MPAVNLCLLFLLAITSSATCSRPRPNVTTITQESVRGGGQGGGRLSLINYRFHGRKPRKKHLDAGELKLVLGSSYDPRFMSIEAPASKESGPLIVGERSGWRFGEMLRELEAINLTQQLKAVAGERIPFGAEHARVVEKWLIKKASCPVKYAWEDIGALFWPRYIRRGECTSEGTCSWPPGMHCVPSATTHIHILRWQCRTPRGAQKGAARHHNNPKKAVTYKDPDEKPLHLKCKWVRVPYPITSECACTC